MTLRKSQHATLTVDSRPQFCIQLIVCERMREHINWCNNYDMNSKDFNKISKIHFDCVLNKAEEGLKCLGGVIFGCKPS